MRQATLVTLILATGFAILGLYRPVNASEAGQDLTQKVWAPQDQKGTHSTRIWLLSGPTDNWHSDSAWFARLGPHLANNGYRAIAIDRATIFAKSPEVKPGYCQFGRDLRSKAIQTKGDYAIIAFASANLAVNCLLQDSSVPHPRFILMLDPDALTPFTISRYRDDAAPYAQQLEEVKAWIDKGGNEKRFAKIKVAEYQHLRELAKGDSKTDWEHVDKLFANREKKSSQKHLVEDIAVYPQDLEQAKAAKLPTDIPLMIIDSDFESAYLDKEKDEKEKQAIIRWRDESSEWFKRLIRQHKCGFYVPTRSQEHLLTFSKPLSIVNWVKQLDQRLACQ